MKKDLETIPWMYGVVRISHSRKSGPERRIVDPQNVETLRYIVLQFLYLGPQSEALCETRHDDWSTH